MGSCRLNTGCRVDRKQVTSTLIRVPPTCTRFDSIWKTFRCVSGDSLLLIFPSLTWQLEAAFSPSLTTAALNHSSMGWFGACPCRPAPGGHTPILDVVASVLIKNI
jgi:hypothetical protein